MRVGPFDRVMDELGFPAEPGVPEGSVPLDDGTSADLLTVSVTLRLDEAHELLKSVRRDLIRAGRTGGDECCAAMAAIYDAKVAAGCTR
jgi:hypothetical protein